MKKNSIKDRAKKVPTEIKLMVSRSMAIAKQINRTLVKQGKTQKDLADMLGKKESEISKWLRGTHNFTIKTIAKIESVLGEQIILTVDQAVQNITIIKAVVADNSEQAICFQPTIETNYIAIENGKQYSVTQSASVNVKTTNKFQLLDNCFAN